MKKQYFPVIGLLILALAGMACNSSVSVGDSPSSSDEVATIVASTMQALTPSAPDLATEEPAPATESAELLPHDFYFLGTDNTTGLTQVFRIERNGTTSHQLTFEPSNVESYDVSLADGSVAYISNRQLLWADINGAGRRVLVDAGPADPIDPIFSVISGVAISPNGQTIAYGLRGINMYSLATNTSTIALPQRPSDIAQGQPAELYWPKNYSPDGTKLLITTAIPNSDGVSTAIYFPATNALVRLSGEGGIFCCDEQGWSADGSTLYSANPFLGMFGSGLWRVDGNSGAITTLLSSDAGGGMFNMPDEPFLAADGQLYYFFTQSAVDGSVSRPPLQLVRSGVDGVTGRTVVRGDNFQLMNEALWAPDASFVIVAFAPIMDVYVGGQAEVTYLDGRPSIVLTTFAQQMKWGP